MTCWMPMPMPNKSPPKNDLNQETNHAVYSAH